MESKYSGERITTIDGVKIDFKRVSSFKKKSNTEPIIRIYTEAMTADIANSLADKIISKIKAIASI